MIVGILIEHKIYLLHRYVAFDVNFRFKGIWERMQKVKQ